MEKNTPKKTSLKKVSEEYWKKINKRMESGEDINKNFRNFLINNDQEIIDNNEKLRMFWTNTLLSYFPS